MAEDALQYIVVSDVPHPLLHVSLVGKELLLRVDSPLIRKFLENTSYDSP